VHTIATVAQARGVGVRALGELTHANAASAFGLS